MCRFLSSDFVKRPLCQVRDLISLRLCLETLEACLYWGIITEHSLRKLFSDCLKTVSTLKNGVQIWLRTLFFRTGRLLLPDWPIASFNISCIWLTKSARHFGFSLSRRFWPVLSRFLWRLADVPEQPAGFFGILWISHTEIIYQANKLLVLVVLPMRSEDRFPFIHRMAFSLVRSYCRSIDNNNYDNKVRL